MMHIAQSNNTFCAKISGQTAPEVKWETDSKDKLVAVDEGFRLHFARRHWRT